MDEAPEEAEVVASWDDAYAENAGGPWPTEPVQAGPSNGDNSNGLVGLVGPTAGPSRPSASEPAASTAGPSQPQASPARGTSTNGRARMRPNASVLHQLLALHKEDSLRAAKAEKRRHRLQVQMLRLQRQATTAQIGMMEMMKEFFASRPNKNL